MKTQRMTLLALFCLGVLVAVGLVTGNAESQLRSDVAQGWKHLALTHEAASDFSGGDLGRRIEQLGSEGWQLVDVESIVENGTTTKMIFCFKRPGR